jgi:phosphohistidine phosphatase
MKTLYLIRHGKSSWDSPSQKDHERTLLEKGIQRTQKVARFMAEKGVAPDLIISSHAVRAYETAKIIASFLNYPEKKIRIEEDLYFNGMSAMENLIFSMDDDVDQLMLVGHNPDMTDFVNLFINPKIFNLPTTGSACFRFNIANWNDIFSVQPEKVFYIAPKEIG